jgi:hypothetical protein
MRNRRPAKAALIAAVLTFFLGIATPASAFGHCDPFTTDEDQCHAF